MLATVISGGNTLFVYNCEAYFAPHICRNGRRINTKLLKRAQIPDAIPIKCFISDLFMPYSLLPVTVQMHTYTLKLSLMRPFL